ncbi:MAG: hypothetical protein JXR83_16560 [Deltaproteobacteria bacterium]|nr:hypothetical protein [Deltaproteobacteria bacterium]
MKQLAAIARCAAAVAICALATTATACGKRCDTAAGCVKECICNDVANSVRIKCQIMFNCDESGVCDPGYDKSCEEFCQTYASIDACGNRQCADDKDCTKRCQCQTQGGIFFCDQPFACDKEHGVCVGEYRDTPCENICTAGCGFVLIRDQ